jgi:spore maturation protein CgeB
MRFLIVNTDYSAFVADLYRQHHGLSSQPSEDQMQLRFATLFGVADFYSGALRALGHEAKDVILNLAPAQRQWATEQSIELRTGSSWSLRRSRLGIPIPRRHWIAPWMFDVLEAQIKDYQPDVLYCMCLEDVGSSFIDRVRPYIRLAVGQHAAPHSTLDLTKYDLILSSLPNFVHHYRALGINSHLFRLGFSARALMVVDRGAKRHELVFIGGVEGAHDQRTRMLEALCERLPVKVWGYGVDRLPRRSAIRACHQGPVWGAAMYQVLADAKVVFNQHIGIAGEYANNMRLYESTGVGSFLLTDWKQNIAEIFEPGLQVETYRSFDECIAKAEHFLHQDIQREAIATRGQERTLSEHEYGKRMAELIKIVGPYLDHPPRR